MASTTIESRQTSVCKPKTCPSCGRQECFERPRFFCGQLLTDKDLDAAQRYVIEKNKLHNRYLVGSGVVCGLAVRCDACDGAVSVEPGYAIDCCGNDIVVCQPQKFDVLDYIKRCFKRQEDGCEGKIQPAHSRCDDGPKQYCLVVSYNEIHTHPVTALARGNNCQTARCEPSRTDEVFRFDLVEEEPPEKYFAERHSWITAGDSLAVFLLAAKKFYADFGQARQIQDATARHDALKNLFCRTKANVLEAYKKGPRVRCTVADHLREIEEAFPWNRDVPHYDMLVHNAMFRLFGWHLRLSIDSLCDALLVPCTECCGEEGVVLACITVQDNRIEQICNTARRQVLTGPAMRHWLQPVYTQIQRLLEYVCCELKLDRAFDIILTPGIADTGTPLTTQSESGQPSTQQNAQPAYQPEPQLGRVEAAFRMASDYSAATKAGLRSALLLQLTDPQTLTALDLYQLPAEQAKAKLAAQKVGVSVLQAQTEDEAYAFGNLTQIAWVITPQSDIELVVDPEGRVTGIRNK
jgi:hypothetical protein